MSTDTSITPGLYVMHYQKQYGQSFVFTQRLLNVVTSYGESSLTISYLDPVLVKEEEVIEVVRVLADVRTKKHGVFVVFEANVGSKTYTLCWNTTKTPWTRFFEKKSGE